MVRDLCENFKWNHIHMIGGPEGEERKKGKKQFWRNETENFPKPGRETDIHVKDHKEYQTGLIQGGPHQNT